MFLTVLINFNVSHINLYASSKDFYGRVLKDGVHLYSKPIDAQANKIFEIPQTYFVNLIGEENELFYKASYQDIDGYVKKGDVSCINGSPVTPYVTNVNFRVFVPGGVNLRRTPYETLGTTNLILAVPFMETNLKYYGKIEGEEAISYKGTTWYFCKYIKVNQEFNGYMYSPLCDLLPTIPVNTEVFEYITKPDFDNSGNSIITKPGQNLSFSTPTQIAIIVAVSLPCIAIIYFLFKPTKIAMQSSSEKTKRVKNKLSKKIKRLKGSDYYELDDEFFN